jgi:predicted murein hydrolase (TIGR00659 family)
VTPPFSLWVYLSTSPLLWLTVTLAAWVAADALARLASRNPLVNPVLIAVALVAALLKLTATPYRIYFDGAQFVHFLLGPATVALALPLYRNWPLVRRNLLPMAAALAVGSVTAIASALAIAASFGVPRSILVSLAPKSVTAAVAMAISEGLGGEPALTAVLVIATGIVGAVMVTPLMNALRIRNFAARGFAVGLAAHGIGTARAFTVDPVAGTFAGVAMGLNAVMTPLIAPALLWLLSP